MTLQELRQFRVELLQDLKELIERPGPSQKQWLKSSEVRKMLRISHGTSQNSVSKMYCLSRSKTYGNFIDLPSLDPKLLNQPVQYRLTNKQFGANEFLTS